MDGQAIFLSYKEAFGKAAPCPPTCLYFRRLEVPGKAIRANSSSKEITVNNTEIRLVSANRASSNSGLILIIKGTQDTLSIAPDAIENFGNSSGLKLNGKETEAL